jgi:hypothetical protein
VSKSQVEALYEQLHPVISALSDADLLATLSEARATGANAYIVAALHAEAFGRGLLD